MAENKLYNNLLALPLFLGMSRNDLQAMVGATKLDFIKLPTSTTIAKDGDLCEKLYFLLKGDIMVITTANDHGYTIEENISEPNMFQPERIFGLTPCFTHSYTTKTECSLMSITKKDIMKLSDKYEICRLNLLNIISTRAQKASQRQFRPAPKNLQEAITRFFEARCLHPAGEKTFYIKMTRIAAEVNDSRLDVSHVLNSMQQQQLLSLHRGRIHIPRLELLINTPT